MPIKHSSVFSTSLVILLAFIACGAPIDTQKKVPDNFPIIKKKKSATIYKPFEQGISYKIVTYQQYFESKKTKGKPAEKHLITLSKPFKGSWQEGSYSFIRQNDFEMIHIYDSVNDIEYMERKM